ncbi:MAG: T4SS-associated protein EirA [bacterium]
MPSSVHKYFLLSIVLIFFTAAIAATPNNVATAKLFCPQAEDLIKEKEFWVTRDGKWKNYTPSTATKVTSFLGAQWSGIKIGKIICLYQTNEAVGFPLAVEQMSSQAILEPSGSGWSALTGNRRFCKSASIADCYFLPEPQRDTSNIYKEIEYNPKAGL